jgi:uncharacterized protein DUF3108
MKLKTLLCLVQGFILGLILISHLQLGLFRPTSAPSPDTLMALPLAPADAVPFQAGERLKYRISWSNFVEAGTAELTVGKGSETIANSYRLQLKASTTPAISNLYSFADDFVSLFDSSLAAPIQFEKNFVERKRRVLETVAFDQLNRTATVGRSGQFSKVNIEAGTQDPLSALYAVRGLVLRPGLQVSLPVLDGGKTFQLDVRVTGTDLISTALGSFNTHRVEVNLRRDGVNLTDKKITIWLTGDNRKVPVLASVSLAVGSALIELISQSN